MHLQNEFGTKPLLLQRAGNAQHRQFDDIRAAALQGHVHRRALAEAAHVVVGRVDFPDIAFASQKRGYVPLFPRLPDIAVHKRLYFGVV